MRILSLAGILVLSGLSLGAFAAEPVAATAPDASAQCQPVTVDGHTSMACFNLSEDQVRSLATDERDPLARRCWRVCNVRVIGPCLIWHRECRW